MAEIIPFKAWRYHPKLNTSIASLTSPLFDVINDDQRALLYENPLNSIHLSVPKGENPHDKAMETLHRWKENSTLVQDVLPSIYTYYQYFHLPHHNSLRIRKGFIAFIKINDWDKSDILRHEATMPHSVQDRIDVLDGTQMNVSPTHGLYVDPEFKLEKYFDESIKRPIYDVQDYQGVRDVFGAIQNAEVIREIQSVMMDRKVILADGHHRLDGSIQYMQTRRANNPHHTGYEPYNYHLMYFTNTESDDLKVLPTHRLIRNEGVTVVQEMSSRLNEFFYTKETNFDELTELLDSGEWHYGLILSEKCLALRLREGLISEISWDIPDMMKTLDVTILHYFIIEKILGISRNDQYSSQKIYFEKDIETCQDHVMKGKANMALIAGEIPIQKIKEVCHSGHTMPQKTTYFYPKVITGFLFGSIHENEFESEFDPGF